MKSIIALAATLLILAAVLVVAPTAVRAAYVYGTFSATPASLNLGGSISLNLALEFIPDNAGTVLQAGSNGSYPIIALGSGTMTGIAGTMTTPDYSQYEALGASNNCSTFWGNYAPTRTGPGSVSINALTDTYDNCETGTSPGLWPLDIPVNFTVQYYVYPQYTAVWAATQGDWSQGGNWSWSNALPTALGDVYVTNGGTANISQPGAACKNLYLGDPNSSTVVMSGNASLSANSTEYIGNNGPGTFIQSGGTHSIISYLCLGRSSGTYNLSGGQLSVSAIEDVGFYGTGTLLQSGGTNTTSSALYVGVYAGSSGTYNLGGGLLSAPGESIGFSGTGVFTQSGGTNSISGGTAIFLGENAGDIGTYNLKGGLLSASFEMVGDGGTGIFTQTNGTNNIRNSLYLGDGSDGTYSLMGGLLSARSESVGFYGTCSFAQTGGTNSIGGSSGLMLGSSGTYNLSGGLFVLSAVSQASGSAAFSFSGGTLQAGSAFSTSVAMTLGNSGGATFDTAGYSVTLSGSLSGPGSLTLDDSLGTGTLILAGTNYYTGGTIVDAGKLVVTNPAALLSGGNLSVGADAVSIFAPLAAAAQSPTAVPEPSTFVLLGFAAIGFMRRKWVRGPTRAARTSTP